MRRLFIFHICRYLLYKRWANGINKEEVARVNFFTVQSMGSYTKNLEMQMKWQKKKTTGDFTADGSTKLGDPIRQQAEEIRKSRKDGSSKLSAQIDLKLQSGKKLTAEEMDYLQKTDPQKYQKIKAMEAEQENYEKELKRCKTKEEVQRVRMTHTATSLNAVNSIMNNPVIPEEKKFELIMQEHYKHMALETSTQEFVESGRYAALPTEAEKAKAEKDLEEAKKAELGIEEPSEETEETETDETKDAEPKEPGSTEKEAEAEKIRKDHAALELAKIRNEREMTRMEAESTPEAMKVKRARAQAAYKENQPEIISVRQALDVKVGAER